MQCTPTSAIGPPPATEELFSHFRGCPPPAENENSERAKIGIPICPAATRSRSQAVLSSKRNTWATPSNTLAFRAAPTIFRHSCALIAIGFSHSTGFPHSIASSTSCRWQALGVATNTASTSGERHKSSAESKASGMLYCRAASCAWLRSRRESAVTRQFRASPKPGISRLTACSPKPRIPKLTMGTECEHHRHYAMYEAEKVPDFVSYASLSSEHGCRR